MAFIGGGNMASAIIGGLIRRGLPAELIQVIEPQAEARTRLKSQFHVRTEQSAGPHLSEAGLVIWAVKPQVFEEAALQARFHTRKALHLSVAAGIRSDSIAHWLGTERLVRAMPNTPALIGKGITGLFARAAVDTQDRQLVEQVVATTGQYLWLQEEGLLDAVTALSGSGPAYVYYFMETMVNAGVEMGLTREQSSQLAIATFRGAAELAHGADEPLGILRQRVTSKGGTTHAAIVSMEQDNVRTLFTRAMHAARLRAREMAEEFGKNA